MLPLYDIHAHLADPRVLPEVEGVLAESRRRGVHGVLVTAARHGEWPTVSHLAAAGAPAWGAVGLHPFFIDSWRDEYAAELRDLLAAEPRLIAVGEIGLDFVAGRAGLARQVAALEAQLAVAAAAARPVILHNRRSWPEFLAAWRRAANRGRLAGVCHQFGGSREIARALLDAGLHLSFGGPLTYPQSRRLREAAAYAPADRVLTETDTPDLPPAAGRGGESRPWHVREVLEQLALCQGRRATEMAAQVEDNFHALLGTGPCGCAARTGGLLSGCAARTGPGRCVRSPGPESPAP